MKTILGAVAIALPTAAACAPSRAPAPPAAYTPPYGTTGYAPPYGGSGYPATSPSPPLGYPPATATFPPPPAATVPGLGAMFPWLLPVASPAGTPAPAPPKAGGSPAGAESVSFQLVNGERSNPANQGETGGRALPLQWDETLAQVARAHSRDMIARGYFSHVNPDGLSPGERMRRAGVAWRAMAENIAMNATVEGAHRAFMNEPPQQANHRGNILNPTYTHLGVGVATDSSGRLFVTQDFRR